ncbi:hypothetical protein B0A55_03850 [Friedmanniomyces simplex]|uniref:Uncharacterized protein n=1 Tax=Friedmanniomyces simplex TaxID=329884 RepID=A0A4U0XFQ0_9PEZI|nr:hypothetical protein B0A55_03850 [Friedmanniomyces simplex]
MEKIKNMLGGHGHAKDGDSTNNPSSSNTTSDGLNTNSEYGMGGAGADAGAGTTGVFTPEQGHGLLGKSYHPTAEHGLNTGGPTEGSHARHGHGESAAEKAAYRQEMTEGQQDRVGGHGHEHGHHSHGRAGEEAALAGTGAGIGGTRGAEDIAGARQEYAGDRAGGLASQGGMGGATGLETNDGYAAARQAGALPNKNDISNVDRDVAAGGLGGAAGYGGSQRTTGGLMEGGSTGHGLNAGANDPMAVRGEAPISEPIHQDPSLMGDSMGGQGGSALGRQDDSMLGGQSGSTMGGLGGSSMGGQGVNAGSGVGQEGLIHGHHTTATGEALDPHLRGGQ